MPASTQQFTQHTRTAPAAAMLFNLGKVQFADSTGTDSKKVPIKLLGRTGQPIQHWYWGNVVHDMAGMKLAKDTLPLDYCHFPDEVLGYLDHFDVSSGDLVATGELVLFADDDRASEVAFKAKEGVPYEASINFAGGAMRLEEIDAGITVKVNGNDVTGPALIIREWTLRGIAVCPYGADMNTNTQLSAKAAEHFGGTVQVTLFKAGDMPKTNEAIKQNNTEPKPANGEPQKLTEGNGNAPVEKQPVAPKPAELTAGQPQPESPKVEAPKADAPKPGTEFVAAFGDIGARWYLEGRAFNECASEFIKGKDTKITELSAEVEKLKGLLADLPRGNEAVGFKATADDKGEPLPKGVKGGAAAIVAGAMSARRQQV